MSASTVSEKCMLYLALCCVNTRRKCNKLPEFSTSNCCENRKVAMEELCNSKSNKLRRNSSESAEQYFLETLNSAMDDDVAFFTPRSYYHKVDMENDTKYFTPRTLFNYTDMGSDPGSIHTSLFETV